MPPREYLLIALAVLMLVVLPLGAMGYAWWYWRLPPAERRRRREAARESTGGAMIGGALTALDQTIRPSAEHTIEAQQKIIKEDENDGE